MHLFTTSLIEVSIGILIAALIAIGLTVVLFPFTENLFGNTIFLSEINQPLALTLFIALLLLTILINSVAPALLLSKIKTIDFLRGLRSSTGKQYAKQALLAFQLVISIVLIAVVMIILKQVDFIKHHDLGFEEEHLVRFDIPRACKSPTALSESISKLSFVESGTISDGYPGCIGSSNYGEFEESRFRVKCIDVSDNFLKTMKINLIDGREFHLGDEGKTCLINEVALKKFGWETIENKVYEQGVKGGAKVIGLVEDFNISSLHSPIEAVALIYDPDEVHGTLSIRLEPGDVPFQLSEVKKIWKAMFPNEPMTFAFYDQQFENLYHKEERLSKSISFFSLIALVLTCMGMLSQIILISAKRTKEIGIRKVNGATTSEILLLLNADFIKWVAIAFVIACPIAWYAMSKWLENFAYKTELSWWIFALAGVLALAIALLTVSFQSLKAARRNPIESLRYE